MKAFILHFYKKTLFFLLQSGSQQHIREVRESSFSWCVYMVVIRLSRVGVKHNPFYRVCVADSRRSVLGQFIEIIGHYNPLNKKFSVKEDRYRYWASQGAQPSLTVKNLFNKHSVR